MTLQICGQSPIHHVAVAVTNLAKARRLFEEVLGFTVQKEHLRADGSVRSLWFDLGHGSFLALEEVAGGAAKERGWAKERGSDVATMPRRATRVPRRLSMRAPVRLCLPIHWGLPPTPPATGSDVTTTDEDPALFNMGPEFPHWDDDEGALFGLSHFPEPRLDAHHSS